jgi:hypothetical protein
MYIGKFVTSFFQHNDRSLKAKAPLKEPDLMNYILTGGNSPVCSLILGGKHQEGKCCLVEHLLQATHCGRSGSFYAIELIAG